MSLALNKVILAGKLTRDPEVKNLSGTTLASFGLAINRRFKKADGTAGEEATFIDVDTWGKTAEFAGQYLTKGAGIYLEGRLKLEGWETKDGEKRQRIKVVADQLQFTTPKRDGDKSAATAGAPATGKPAASSATDEPPF